MHSANPYCRSGRKAKLENVRPNSKIDMLDFPAARLSVSVIDGIHTSQYDIANTIELLCNKAQKEENKTDKRRQQPRPPMLLGRYSSTQIYATEEIAASEWRRQNKRVVEKGMYTHSRKLEFDATAYSLNLGRNQTPCRRTTSPTKRKSTSPPETRPTCPTRRRKWNMKI